MSSRKQFNLASFANTGRDATKAYQRWLDSIDTVGIAPTGRYVISTFLTCKPDVHLIGLGDHKVVKSGSFPTGAPMLQVAGGSSFHMHGMTFDGNDQPATNSLLAFLVTPKVSLTDCSFLRSRYMGIQLYRCPGSTLRDVTFDDWGKVEKTEEGGAAVWTEDCDDLVMVYNTFRNGRWSPLYWNGTGGCFVRNTITNCAEGGIFGGPNGVTIAYNKISGIRLVWVSAHGFEIGGSDNSVHHNEIDDCDGECIHIAGERYTVTDNTCLNGAAGGIILFSHGQLGLYPHHSLVARNIVRGTAPYGIALAKAAWPGSQKMHDISVIENDIAGTFSRGAIVCDPVRG